jgi:hypothetical protein
MTRRARAVSLVATVMAGGLLLGTGPHPDHDSLRIDTVSPACAKPGDTVAITGDGLSPRAIRISVGGVPAHVVAATGHRATFVVPAGLPLGSAVIVATRTHGHHGHHGHHGRHRPDQAAMPFDVCDLPVPAGWVGQWRIALTYRDATTNRVVAVDRVTSGIRPGEPLGLGLLRGAADCAASVTEDAAEARCEAALPLDACTAHATTTFALERHGDILTGSGLTEAGLTGPCPASREATAVELSGVRLAPEAGATSPGLGVLQRFVRSSAVRFVRTVRFESFTVEKLKAGRRTLHAEGTFELAQDSDGIDPVAEEVRIGLGAFGVTLPAGAFAPLHGKHRRGGRFKGVADGVRLDVTIQPGPRGLFAFTIHATGADVDEGAGPLLVSLLIGGDSGTASVRPSGVR